ncbi:WcaF family extracellular polysaccharide biosynthesis acetyltransferase [Pseudobacter ginsenosidimutans]|uniref:Putative colanic acid biosynthesis acetyltransferase WcaF n=1 Tax=Pseudobacter ginsenosidimutans TaxID=661488 RepID=A0A4Q7MUG7_9BACT|nr:WcaF family extracellular polysaccharide biosynthesis acetyltransferase [Pseudobacter ginsenosidimutans]QEC41031.1 colanic acid biosynthesis acetyltransferase WcaF [Pseudobacter ginsenosidimutans]RZS72218.1 putative colanic acid biosynthesis acetyltransferase WcaF [Pseudobacter ginsenosidimutans]
MNRFTDLSTYNNDWYKKEIGASKLKQVCWYFLNVLFFINPLNPSSWLKRILLKMFGAKIGKGVIFKPAINIKYPWKLTIGDNSWIGEKVWIDNLGIVSIGKNVCLSQGAMLLTGNHNFAKTNFELMVDGIILEDGVWIGAQALVCPGVNCATHAVLTARSVATRNLDAFTIYQGNPAVAVKQRAIIE